MGHIEDILVSGLYPYFLDVSLSHLSILGVWEQFSSIKTPHNTKAAKGEIAQNEQYMYYLLLHCLKLYLIIDLCNAIYV